jgi:NAD(P)H-hydrate epimerase
MTMPRTEGISFELTRAGARALDATAQRDYAIPGIVLMENAAIGMARVAEAWLALRSEPSRVLVVAGGGNNGGDGYGIARHLANAGHAIGLLALREPRAGSEAAVQAAIIARMALPVTLAHAAWAADASRWDSAMRVGGEAPDLLVDAIVGTGLDRPLEGLEAAAVAAIARCRRRGASVLSVDLPSGIDNDNGEPLGPAVCADLTCVTVAPRPAMRLEPAASHFGRVSIIDIGAPAALVQEFGRD